MIGVEIGDLVLTDRRRWISIDQADEYVAFTLEFIHGCDSELVEVKARSLIIHAKNGDVEYEIVAWDHATASLIGRRVGDWPKARADD